MFKKMYTTEMTGSRKTIEKRFHAIKSNKKRGIITGVSVIFAAVIAAAGVRINSSLFQRTQIYEKNDSIIVTATINPQESLAMVNPYMSEINPYNNKYYINITGKTVADVAEEMGLSLPELLAEYSLPSDMPADTHETAAYAMIPCRKIAETYNMNFNELKEIIGFPYFITEDTPWGEALDEVTLGNYIGTDSLTAFKDYYGLGDEITSDTQWKEVRYIVEEKQRQERIAAENSNE